MRRGPYETATITMGKVQGEGSLEGGKGPNCGVVFKRVSWQVVEDGWMDGSLGDGRRACWATIYFH